MCGIAGAYLGGRTDDDVDLMLAAIAHRGPDEFGTYTDDDVSMGAARLSIIDIATGQQPIRHEATGVVIVFNGEIFNYVELREDLLKKNYTFSTKSDTEVILNLYLEHGLAFANHLNGQFAIAIWDPRIKRLVLARDRFGICPLFLYQEGSFLAFASEMKSLFTEPRIPRQLDLRTLDQVFTFWTPIAGNTAFVGIRELQPGCMLVVEENSDPRITAYWRWEFPSLQTPVTMSFETAREAFLARLCRAVSIRLRADIEVGAYLSGGIDSSAIVALATRLQPSGVRTFGLAFAEASYDESPFQDMVAKVCNTKHLRTMCDYADIDAYFERAVWHAEVPLFRTAPSPLYRLSEAVRASGIKVILTGEGSDEILLGYDLFREVKIRRLWQRRPDSKVLPEFFKQLYAYLPQFTNPRFANLAVESFRAGLNSDSPFYSHVPRWSNNAANKVFFSSATREALAGYNAHDEMRRAVPEEFFQVDDVDRAQYLEINTLLRGYLLSSQADRMTMANSVEGRYPFLDHELVHFASTLPRRAKLRGLRDKYILREAFTGMLPKEICHRPKFAYQAPEARAFIRPDHSRSKLVDEHLSPEAIRDTGVFSSPMVEQFVKKLTTSDLIRLGMRDNMAVVQILSTQILMKKFIHGDIRGAAKKRCDGLSFKTRIRLRTSA